MDRLTVDAPTHAVPTAPAPAPSDSATRSRTDVTVVLVLLVIATVPWRADNAFSGGVDSVVIAKGLVTVVALCLALRIQGQSQRTEIIRTPPVVFLAIYLSFSTFGAWSSGDTIAGAILSVRVAMIAAIVVLLAVSVPSARLLRSLFDATTIVALCAAVTGVSSLASGRLAGGVPQIHSNELAALCAISVLGVGWRLLNGEVGLWSAGIFLVLFAALWATGSRSSFIAAIIGLLIMIAHVRRMHASVVVALHAAAAALTYVVLVTDLFGSFVRRGDDGLSTLTSRTVAWSAAFDYSDSPWTRWLGSGLAFKQIPVEGQYWDTQPLDSSWISGLVHAGRAGAVLLIVWACWALVVSRRGSRQQRMILTPILAYLLIRSTLENGLVDSSLIFVVFLTVSLVSVRAVGPHAIHDDDQPPRRTPGLVVDDVRGARA